MEPLVTKQTRIKGFRLPLRLLGGILIAALIVSPGFSFAKDDEDVTRIEFIQLMAKNQSQSKMLPANASSLSEEELFKQVAQNLKENGFNVLSGKNPDKPLTQQEFVRLTYAFSDQPSGKSLFEQKQYLKEAEIISTADVGLTTGLQGRAVQYRGEEDAYSASELAAPVFMQDRVETDLNSMITFTFDDGSTMSLGEDAVVNITEHVYDPERDFRKTIVNVALGAVRFKVTKGKAEGSMFQVITPVATAGVRGTEFVTIVEPGGKTRFVGLEGKVETFPRLANGKEGKHEFVVAGTMHDISKNGSSSGLKKADAAMMDKVFQKTNPKLKLKKRPTITMAKAMRATQGKLNLGKAIGKNNKAKKAKNSKKGKKVKKAKKEKKNKKGKGNKKQAKGKNKDKGKKGKSGKSKMAGKGKKGGNSAGKLTKGAGKNAAKSAAKGTAKAAAKTAAKDTAKGAAKSSARTVAKNVAKDVAKSTAKDTARRTAKDVSKVAVMSVGKGSDKDSAKDAAKGAAKNLARGAAKDVAKGAAKDAAKSAAKNAARKAAKMAALQSAKASIQASTRSVLKQNGNGTGGNPNPRGNPNFVPPGQSGTSPGVGNGGTPPGLGGNLPPGLGGGNPGNGGGPPCGIPPCGNGNGKGPKK